MAKFEDAIENLLIHEGGLVEDPADPGGLTNFGISARFFLAVNPRNTLDDLRMLTRDQAAEIYREEYWRFDGVEDQVVATKLLDMAANLGLKPTTIILQQLLGIAVDGIFGPATEEAVHAAKRNWLLSELRARQACYYARVIKAKPETDKFLLGWMRRAVS